MEITEIRQRQINLCELPTGTRLIIQCKKDWRMAVVSTVREESVILQICSPTGRTYRKKCAVETFVYLDGAIPFLGEGIWKETFAKYDFRW
jgi:hypothetical protein